jgi:D-alanyl-D-alanine carboxypeptidase
VIPKICYNQFFSFKKKLYENMKKRYLPFYLILLSFSYSGGIWADILEQKQKAIADFLTSPEKLVVAEDAENLIITPSLEILKKDHGKLANLFVIATIDGSFFVNSEESGWIHYSGTLHPFRSSVTLGDIQSFPIYTGSQQKFFNLFSKSLKSDFSQQPEMLKNLDLENDLKKQDKVIHIFYAYRIKGGLPIFYGNHFQLTASTMAQKLQQLMDEKIAENEIPGAVMAVMIPGEGKWVGTSGVSDLENQTKMHPSNKFRIVSITKTFTALINLQLAQEGKLGLDDTLKQWLPGVVCGQETKDCSYVCDDKNCGFDPEKITIRMLLTHFSGIPDFAKDLYKWVIPSFIQPDKVFTPTELINIALAFGPLSEPGKKWNYANINYVLLGMVIEKVTGSAWEDEVQNRFVKPLKLTNTIIPNIGKATLQEPYARGYIDLFEETGGAAGEKGILVEHSVQDPGFTWSSGNMISTPENMMYWIKQIAEGALLNETYQQKMLTFTAVPSIEGLEIGLGIFKALNDDTIGHIGQFSGYDCTVQYQPVHAIPISVCANRTLAESGPKNIQALMIGDAFAILTKEEKSESRW